MNSPKRLLSPLGALLLVACLSIFSCQPKNSNDDGQSESKEQNSAPDMPGQSPDHSLAVITVHFEAIDSSTYSYNPTWTGEMTLGKALSDNPDLAVKMKDYPGMGRLVTSINGIGGGEGEERYWQFCVNGTGADKGIDQTELRDGDQVDWNFVAFNELPCKKIGE